MPDATLAGGTASAACYHCGLPVPVSAPNAWTVRIDDTDRAMCCPGCAAVAQAIVDLGQQSYLSLIHI